MNLKQTLKKLSEQGYTEAQIRCAMNQAKISLKEKIKIKNKNFKKIMCSN